MSGGESWVLESRSCVYEVDSGAFVRLRELSLLKVKLLGSVVFVVQN